MNHSAERTDALLRTTTRVINIGLERFANDLESQGVAVVDVDWSPPAGGNPGLTELLSRLEGPTGRDDIENANRLALDRMLIIPAQVIHTSRNVGAETAWLIDLFAPPRRDFSERPGFVCNADDYPMPEEHAS